ncbi:three-helix bundle dimerization domain-containing protein [Streptomyces sp. NPDC057540]|uniref:three-helix bundle dimerization domain-containing protein n=1 Tax=Streptomyces sp. NPDC057540 TaxID=3346160 RepID=UPI0036A999CB
MADSEEDARAILLVVGRLVKAHPRLDADLVRKSVQTAYEELRYARVRTYLPVLMERRAKDLLPPDEWAERNT